MGVKRMWLGLVKDSFKETEDKWEPLDAYFIEAHSYNVALSILKHRIVEWEKPEERERALTMRYTFSVTELSLQDSVEIYVKDWFPINKTS